MPTYCALTFRNKDPEKLWRQYMQLIEIEAVFRTLKSELSLRPIFHRIQSRVEAHILIAFLGLLSVGLPHNKKLSFPLGGKVVRLLKSCNTLEKQILMVEVWFDLRPGG